ncbi:tetratricopeptide repeat protein [Henriciella aquimarina]|uniref:hypothetical protein n=1 Tax=Henriciella aquimarina TaxID=545261 RepID=UPI000A0665EA|nr:hypothetical protein [Henriciella aquimarina]
MKKMLAVSVLISLLAVWPAMAERAETAFNAGRFLDAARIAEAEGGADNLAYAARSFLAEAVASGAPAPLQLDRAEALARRALEADPEHIEARLQLAIALSLKSRAMSTGEALESGYGRTACDLVQSVLEDDPDNVYAHGFLAIWNIEVIRRGGGLGAAFMGASMGQARRHYRAATQTGEADLSIDWQFARALASLNARKYRDEIEASLARAAAAHPDTALAEMMQSRALSFRQYVTSHSRRDIEALAASLL